jgi:hypothetical protein
VRAVDLIAAKRDGRPLTADELRFLVEGYVAGRVGDDQMAAWLMAVVWRGLDDAEVDALCAAMVASGDVVDLSPLGGPSSTSTRRAASGTRSRWPLRRSWRPVASPWPRCRGEGSGLPAARSTSSRPFPATGSI